jgi:hypothetical protein
MAGLRHFRAASKRLESSFYEPASLAKHRAELKFLLPAPSLSLSPRLHPSPRIRPSTTPRDTPPSRIAMSVVGIDLGTLNSVIAVARNRGVDVVSTADSAHTLLYVY